MFSYVGQVSRQPYTIVEPSIMLTRVVSIAFRPPIVYLFIAVLIIIKVQSIVLKLFKARVYYSYQSKNSVPKAKEIVSYLLYFKIDYQRSYYLIRVVSTKLRAFYRYIVNVAYTIIFLKLIQYFLVEGSPILYYLVKYYLFYYPIVLNRVLFVALQSSSQESYSNLLQVGLYLLYLILYLKYDVNTS